MHPLHVAIELDVLEDLLLRLVVVFEDDPLGQLALESFVKGFDDGIVIRVSRTRDRLGDVVSAKCPLKRP